MHLDLGPFVPEVNSGCRPCVGTSELMPYTYILKTIKDTYYIGSTNNIDERLNKHNKGEIKSTKNKLPVKLVFKEYYQTKSEAQKKEYKIKKWKSRKMIETLIKQGPFV